MEPIVSEMSSCSLATTTTGTGTGSTLKSPSCVVCSIQDKNVKSCSNCRLIHYCSIQHQKEHWKIHKIDCFPVKEKSHDELGTILVATRNIKEGEQIFQESPLVASPYSRSRKDFWAVCFGCCCVLDKEFLKCKQLCEQCSWPLCGPNCSKILNHSNAECKVFRNAGLKPIEVIKELVRLREAIYINSLYESVQVLRCLLLRENDLTAWNKLVNINSFAERRKLMPFAGKLSNFSTKFVREFCKLKQFSPDLIDQVFGISCIHGCTNGTIEAEEIRPSLCVSTISEKASKLAHSCFPNSEQRTTVGVTSRVLALRDIERGQIITESVDHDSLFMEDVVGRRKYLHANHFFWCTCAKCSDRTELGSLSSAVKCQKFIKATSKNCHGFYLPLNPLDTNSRWKCTNPECGWLKCYQILRKETLLPLQMEMSKSKTLEENMLTLERNANVTVHENHAYLVYLRHQMITPFALKMEKNRDDPNFKELNTQFLELMTKCLDLYTNFGLGRPNSKGVILFNKALAIENTLPPGSFLEQFQPTPEYLECVTAAVDFVRDFKMNSDEVLLPPMDRLELRWYALKQANAILLKAVEN